MGLAVNSGQHYRDSSIVSGSRHLAPGLTAASGPAVSIQETAITSPLVHLTCPARPSSIVWKGGISKISLHRTSLLLFNKYRLESARETLKRFVQVHRTRLHLAFRAVSLGSECWTEQLMTDPRLLTRSCPALPLKRMTHDSY